MTQPTPVPSVLAPGRVARQSLAVAWAGVQALFFREVLSRVTASRGAWLWLVLEPIAHVCFLMTVFGFIFHRSIAGIDGALFVMTGLLGFFLFRNTALRAMAAIQANQALFAYRQIRPIDTVLVRALVELILSLLSCGVLVAGAVLLGYAAVPVDMLHAGAAWLALWLLGLGLGLMLSALGALVPEVAKLAGLMMTPLYFVSGVMVPANAIPQPWRDVLLVNPVMQGLESLRTGWFEPFHAANGTSLGYVYAWGLVALLLGMGLHLRFANRLAST